MGKWEKFESKIMSNPLKCNLDFNEIKIFLERKGFVVNEGGKGSHFKATHEKLNYVLIISRKGGRHKKPGYIVEIREALLELIEWED